MRLYRITEGPKDGPYDYSPTSAYYADSEPSDWFNANGSIQYLTPMQNDAQELGLDFSIIEQNDDEFTAKVSGSADALHQFMENWGYFPEDYGL